MARNLEKHALLYIQIYKQSIMSTLATISNSKLRYEEKTGLYTTMMIIPKVTDLAYIIYLLVIYIISKSIDSFFNMPGALNYFAL